MCIEFQTLLFIHHLPSNLVHLSLSLSLSLQVSNPLFLSTPSSSSLFDWFMDIEPFWTLEEEEVWFLFPICMAALIKPSSQFSEPFFTTRSQSLHLRLLILLLFVSLIILINFSDHGYSASTATFSQLPLKPSQSAETNTDVHKTQAASVSAAAADRREYGADEHNVPSGPNPISN